MRVISGKARGVELNAPAGFNVRPTSARAREALFSSIGETIYGALAVDLFAGAGTLGLEAASRGAESVYFVENSRPHCEFLADNIQKALKAGTQSFMRIIEADVTDLNFKAHIHGRPSFVFADPPYNASAAFFEKISTNPDFSEWASQAVIIWELPEKPADRGMEFLTPGLLNITEIKKLGGTEFMFCKPTGK